MRKINLETWPRREHFNVFRTWGYPHFNFCANVDLTLFYPEVKKIQLFDLLNDPKEMNNLAGNEEFDDVKNENEDFHIIEASFNLDDEDEDEEE